MKISFTGSFKSLTAFTSESLPDFTIITGKNGSGKSQLIEAIKLSYENKSDQGFNLTIVPKPERCHVSEFVFKDVKQASQATLNNSLNNYSNWISKAPTIVKEFYTLLDSKKFDISKLEDSNRDEVESILEISESDLNNFVNAILSQPDYSLGFRSIDSEERFNRAKYWIKRDYHYYYVTMLIAKFKDKSVTEVLPNDVYTSPIPEKHVDNPDLFYSSIETVFLNYLKRRRLNDYLLLRKTLYEEQNDGLNEKEFANRYPAPWNILNKLLGNLKIDLSVTEYGPLDYSDGMHLTVTFRKKNTSVDLKMSDLSSGEQVIIGLILKLFTKDYYLTDLKFPSLIIFDEPDAYLHPEMAKLLIDVLAKSIVEELGIKIILTTHSAATVALAPDDSIFEMKNSPSCSLGKVNKDYALNLLTGSIPTLSIDYKNHRQVFLESPTDVEYFQRLFNKLNEEAPLDYKLYFIANDKGKGNSSQVVKTVDNLRQSGINKAYGILDWDEKNKSTKEILVHGEEARYSIENFIYDGIYMAILLLEMKGANIHKELSINDDYNQYKLSTESKERIQEVWDWYLNKLSTKFNSSELKNLVTIKYYNNIEIKVPEWFVKTQGHELERKIREIFPFLNQKYNGEGVLQKAVSIIMGKCFPFVPLDSINLIKTLSTKQ